MQLLCSLGHGSRHSLDLELQQKEQMLRKGLITYLGVASEYTGALSHAIWKGCIAYVIDRAGNYCCLVADIHNPTTPGQGNPVHW
jgi:hypothetical protein